MNIHRAWKNTKGIATEVINSDFSGRPLKVFEFRAA